MEKEFTPFRMVADTKENIMRIRSMVKGFTIQMKER